MNDIVWKNPWSDRFLFLENHIPKNLSIVDFGCGNKQILDYCDPQKYLGIDINDGCDLKIDLNENFVLSEQYDLGLMLGVLEYLKDPEKTLQNCIRYANKFLLLTCSSKKKKEWTNSFNEDMIFQLASKYFKKVTVHRYPRYILTIAEEKK